MPSSKDQNLVYFKEVNLDPNTVGLENTTAPNLPLPQQADVEPGTNESPGREPETSYSNSRPEPHEFERIQPPYAGDDGMKQAQSSSQEALTELGPILNNADAGSTGSSSEDSLTNTKLSSSEPGNSKTEAVPLYEGSDVNAMNLRPHYPGSELNDPKAPITSSNPTETKTGPGIEDSSKGASSYERQEEKDARLETFAKLPMNDELPTKSNEPPSNNSITYIPPANAPVPKKKPVPAPIKLPPALALMTPKRGINIFLVYVFFLV